MNPVEYAAALDSGLTQLRAFAEARMTSRCTIRRKTDNFVVVDGQQVPEWVAIYTDLPCRIASASSAARSRTQRPGEGELERATPRVDFPVSASNLTDSDHVEITAGENTGRVFRLIESDWVDQATARRIPVMAVERPSEWSA